MHYCRSACESDRLLCLYNIWLHQSRTRRNKPFIARKTLDNIDEQTKTFLIRIDRVLTRLSHINAVQFIQAPYHLYPGTDFFPLGYFAKHCAISDYSAAMRQLDRQHCDSEYHLKFVARSFKFIVNYCKSNNIKVSEYVTPTSQELTPVFLIHVKQHQVSLYVLFAFDHTINIIRNLAQDILALTLSNFDVYEMYEQWNKSKLCKKICQNVVESLKENEENA